ncbi:MAG: EAL domain-containing protein [Alphaproteobacteria bacterium]
MALERILIIDDEAEIGRFVARVAGRCGYRPVATTDVEEFRQHVRNWQPTHIVLDLHMPEADGVELLRFLAAERSQARIIIASGFDPKVIDSARQLGIERGLSIVATVQKPIRAEALARLLEEVKSDSGWLDEHALLGAIENEEFGLVFQPKVKLNPDGAARPWNEVAGFEALVRWNHPERGLVSPADFIPVAETLGMIDKVTQAVFTLATQQIQAWNAKGLSLSIAINVSAEDLYDVTFVDALAKHCRQIGVSPSQIVIELTETAAMRDVTQAMDILTRLRIKGFQLAMDDFGTGYSSLVQLQRMPFSELKIDQAFIRQFASSEQSRVIVKTMIDMAHNLGLTAVAEGVESEDVLRSLADLQCDIAQGYVIARPLPADAVENWLAQNLPA